MPDKRGTNYRNRNLAEPSVCRRPVRVCRREETELVGIKCSRPPCPSQLEPMDQSHFNSSARSCMCTHTHTRKHLHTYTSKSEVDSVLTSLSFHPEHSLKEKYSKRLRARNRDFTSGKTNEEEEEELDTGEKKTISGECWGLA